MRASYRYLAYQRTATRSRNAAESEHALVRWLSQHILEPDSNPPANKCVSKVINIWCRLSRSQIERAGISIGLAAVYHQFPLQEQAFYHDRHSFEAVLDLNLRQKASTSRRPNVWRKICVCLRGADTFGLALQSRRCTAGGRRGDKKGDTDVHQSALGRLCKKGNRKMRQGFAPVLKRYA